MIEINLYKSGAVNAFIQFPEKWNEIEQEELLQISKHFITPYASAAFQKAAIFISIIEYRAKKAKVDAHIHQYFDAENIALDGLPLVEFLYEDNTRTIQPFHKLELPGYGLVYCNDSHFDTLLTGEYEDADIDFKNFKMEEDLEKNGQLHLANLASKLYRPEGIPYIKYNGSTDENEIYNSEAMVKHFLKLAPEILYTIFTWYHGCRNLIPRIFHTCFENSKEQANPDLLDFTKCIHAAAGAKNGNRDKVRRTLFKALFFDMEQEAIKAKELKAEYERNK